MRIKLQIIIFILIIIYSMNISAVYADRAGIPSVPTDLKEPGQYAIISWYNGLEVLCLSTHLYSDDYSKILKILPLPSIPEISLGDKSIFKKISRLVAEFYTWMYLGGRGGALTIIYTKTLGPHNVTVVRADNATQLLELLKVIAHQNGFNITRSLTRYGFLAITLNNYINRGYNIFAIDIITINAYEDTFIEPIIYKFKSKKIYYPLRISATTFTGDFDLHLYLITASPIDVSSLRDYGSYYTVSGSVFRWELDNVDRRLTEIFPPWILSFYLTYAKVFGYYEYPLDDIELDGPIDISLPAFIIGLIVLGIFAYFLFKLRTFGKLKSNQIFLGESVLLILLPIILVMMNLTVILSPPTVDGFLQINIGFILISTITLSVFVHVVVESSNKEKPSYPTRFIIPMGLITTVFAVYVVSLKMYYAMIYGSINYLFLLIAIISASIILLVALLIAVAILYLRLKEIEKKV